MDVLIKLLEESSNLYKNFLELEYKKYDTVIKNDIETLDDIVSKEQAYYLKIRGIEQKREKLLDSMGYKNMTLKEVIEAADDKKAAMLKEKYEEFAKIIAEVKKISDLCKTIIKVRMHRIDRAIKQLGEKENTYTVQESKNKTKSLLLSKKI
ncbi:MULTISPECIES: flagellar protein FlgN [unclassified Sedimentibacter]|uniref:flagellar protein FlgN n=1 Tax=unclassified Sedimentibacter TaxID=2649220 RepID=UPI0027E171E9|nr:flagellar protein FlgN [Sedimentibacter sp. MB35-C1]WMJ78586.1 flagellar protein FlgN [Sedimentibacter sp. MB35-C1]